MGKQIRFFRKNHLDFDRGEVLMTVTDATATSTGDGTLPFLRNRNNNSGWATTGSNDAANTVLDIDMLGYQTIDTMMLVLHNFKSFLVEYYDNAESIYKTYADITNNAETTTIIDNTVITNKIKITIRGTIAADEDKFMRQLIFTENLGQFNGWPKIQRPTSSLNKRANKMMSGKSNIVEKLGSFSAVLEVKLSNDADLALIEEIYFAREGVLMLLSGGDENQFRTKRIGYKNEDVVLVRAADEYQNPYDDGIYTSLIKHKITLVEAVF